MTSLFRSSIAVGAVNDRCEREADRVAYAVTPVALRAARSLWRAMRPDSGAHEARVPDVTPEIEAGIAQARRAGRALEPDVQDFFEQRFGRDLGGVRVHISQAAARSARDVHAIAYTLGSDIVFAAGRYAPQTRAGHALLAHELVHVIQQGAAPRRGSTLAASRHGTVEPRTMLRAASRPHILQRQPQPSSAPRAQQPHCTPLRPELCLTYEEWIASFRLLPTFRAFDTAPRPRVLTDADVAAACVPPRGAPHPSCFEVLGERGELRDPQTPGRAPPAPIGPLASDHFIDRPTDEWVRANLPEELVETAYRLPSDCADIPLILRHVWLFHHGRTERYGAWTIGVGAGRTRQTRVREIGRLIQGPVSSATVRHMLHPYTDAQGHPIRSFEQLQHLLHPGDVLVWEHRLHSADGRRDGGHTHNVQAITRDPRTGRVTEVIALQGNLPLFQAQAEQIRTDPIGRRMSEFALRHAAPGRRIERARVWLGDVVPGVWGKQSTTRVRGREVPRFTVLIAAGPPAAAARPRVRRAGRAPRLSDWVPGLRASSAAQLQGVAEALLLELRAQVEAGQPPAEAEVRSVASAAGERLWALAVQAAQARVAALGGESHFEPLHRIRALIRAIGGIDPRPSTPHRQHRSLVVVFGWFDDAFDLAARGAASAAFRPRTGRAAHRQVRVLLAGFDPFTGTASAPGPGAWNPSGAAAMALDNQRVDAGRGVTAHVQSVVLPVSFAAFAGRRGRPAIVERVIAPLAQEIDAVLTVSAGRATGLAPLRFEQFAVGVRGLRPLQPHRLLPAETPRRRGPVPIPATRSGAQGPAVLEATEDLTTLAADVQSTATGSASAGPVIGRMATFVFANAREARRALAALGTSHQPIRRLDPQNARDERVEVTVDASALRRIQLVPPPVTGPGIRFRVGRNSFRALSIAGPGGDFLSNEVFYRVLRLLSTARPTDTPSAFHVHTPRDKPIPAAPGREREQALTSGRRLVAHIVATLRWTIAALARRIAGRRGQRAP